MLCVELSVWKARGQQDSDACREALLASGVLLEGEWDRLIPGDRHTTAAYWIGATLDRLYLRRDVLHRDAFKFTYATVQKFRSKARPHWE